MNETKHTSGPWIMHSGAVYKPDGTEDGYPIAHVDRNTPKTMPCERDANARLIAAAPELLEACQAVLTRQDWPVGTVKLKVKLQLAVAKATGGAK